MNDYVEHPCYKPADVDGIFSTAWSLYKKHFILLFGYGFLLSLLISLPASFLDMQEMLELAYTDPAMLLSRYAGKLLLLSLLSLVGNVILLLLLHYFLIYRELEPEQEHISLVGRAFTGFFFPMLITVFLAMVITMVGSVLGIFALIIGAFIALIYFATVFFPVCPVVIVDRLDPLSAIRRVFSLVHNHFWPTMGQMLIYLVIYLVVPLVFSMIALIPMAGSFLDFLSDPPAAENLSRVNESLVNMNNPFQYIIGCLSNGLLIPFYASVSTAVYFNLRWRMDNKAG